MTNKERQRSLDKQKWETSEKASTDFSGKMPYCEFCKHKDNKSKCVESQEEKEQNCLCAKAYNRMKRNNKGE